MDIEAEIEDRVKRQRADRFKEWLAELDRTEPALEWQLKAGLVADLDTNPLRWSNNGLAVLSTGLKYDFNDFNTLPFLLFLLGSEFFLKGMWLCTKEDCRMSLRGKYMEKSRRDEIRKQLQRPGGGDGHDLLRIIDICRDVYSGDEVSLQYLRRVNAIIRCYYYPLYKEESRRWTAARYPVWLYDDQIKERTSHLTERHPRQWLLLELFENQSHHLYGKWGFFEEEQR